VALTVLREGRALRLELTPKSVDGPNNPPEVGIAPQQPAKLGTISAGSPAEHAGLQYGDQVVAVNRRPVLDPGDMIQQIQDAEPNSQSSSLGAAGVPLSLSIKRGSQDLSVELAPRLDTQQGKRQWMIGTAFVNDTTYVQLPFSQAFRKSLDDNKQFSMVILDLVGKLVSRQASIQTLQSPVGIASVAGEAARSPTLLPLFSITSLISLNLGILNLLPIPVLDGGTILFLFIEAVMRHEMSLRLKERIYQVGFAFLLVLMSVVVYNDIVRAVVMRN
jgi:regulator of sigma E protease